MWKMFEKGSRHGDPAVLEKYVDQLVHMSKQKSAGQLRNDNKKDLPFDTLDLLKWSIICEACYLVMDERFEKVKEVFEEDE